MSGKESLRHLAGRGMALPRFQLQVSREAAKGGEDAKLNDKDMKNNKNRNNSSSNNNNNRDTRMPDPEVTATAIVDAAFRIHVRLGPGLLESVYEALLAYEVTRAGHVVLRQKTFGFYYDDVLVKRGLKADLIVDGCVIVEVKAAETTQRVHRRQLLTYLRALDMPLGLLVNFGGATMKEGLSRVVNHHDEARSPLRISRPPAVAQPKWTRLRSWIRRQAS